MSETPKTSTLSLEFAPELWLFLKPRDRGAQVIVPHDGTSSLGHVIESCGVPLTEIGPIRPGPVPATGSSPGSAPRPGTEAGPASGPASGAVSGAAPTAVVAPSHRPRAGDVFQIPAVERPQPIPGTRPSFLLDVHLGALARRLRLVGVDTDYENDLDDDTLVERANRDRRVLLTRDRGILRRRGLWLGAYVRGARSDDQFLDVLDRFAPPLAPFTRCTACNGLLASVDKPAIEDSLLPGTRRSYEAFARCAVCGRVYWPGAHRSRLDALVKTAETAVAGRLG